jgi:phage terminase large subunit-like protein
MGTRPSTDVLPAPRDALLELGLTDDEIDEALQSKPRYLGGCPWEATAAEFEVEAAERALKALRALKHTKTRRWQGVPLDPDPWQVVWIIAPVFGWKYRRDHHDLELAGTRVVREVFIEIPRKNGKTTLSTGLMLVLLTADGEPGAEVYSAAVDRTGANRILDDAKTMAQVSPALRKRVKPKVGVLTYPKTNGIFRALSKVAEAAHGLNVSGAVIDELHVHRTRDLLDAIVTGTGARDQPLVFIITTADEGREHSIYAEYHDRTVNAAKRIVRDPSHYGVIWCAAETDDPFAEETIRKANPGYGRTVTADYLRGQAEKARTTPSYLNTYLRLHLNIRKKSEAGLIRLKDWDHISSVQILDESELEDRPCWGGLDLSSTTDLTAAGLLFPNDAGWFDVLVQFWLPEDNLDRIEHATQVPLRHWQDLGWMRTTEGNVVDYRPVRTWLEDAARRFDLQQVGYDPWNATETINELTESGLTMVPVRQGYGSMSSPTKLLEKLALKHMLRHGGNPVLRWNADCLAVIRDHADNIKPVKPGRDRSKKRIDGMVTLINGLYCWQRRPVEETEDEPLSMFY